MAIKAIVFDLWGTLVENGTYSPLRQTYKILRPRMPFGEFVQKLEQAMMTRHFDDQAAAFSEACDALGCEAKPFIIDRLIGVWNKNKLLAEPYPETLDVLKTLKGKGIKLALLSNTPGDSADFVIDKFGMREHFDVVALSCDTGMLKQEREAFEDVLKGLGVKNDEALMVGDSMETDIKGAEKAGVTPVLIDRRGHREYERKIVDLAQVEEYLE